jgi:hypothetical protein
MIHGEFLAKGRHPWQLVKSNVIVTFAVEKIRVLISARVASVRVTVFPAELYRGYFARRSRPGWRDHKSNKRFDRDGDV